MVGNSDIFAIGVAFAPLLPAFVCMGIFKEYL
jgi:hypothetical protein